MTTHYHLAIETEHPNLHEFMHYLNTAYTVWTNRRNRRTGHLFEGRYKAIVMEDAGYLLSATGYIHLNPVRARGWQTKPVEERMRTVTFYEWSSYSAYAKAAGKNKDPHVSCDRVWGDLHAGSEREGRRRYREYIRGWLKKEEEERSKPKRKRDETVFNPFCETRLGCYLGDDDFRDFILRLLGKDRELGAELVGYRKWRKEVPLSKLVGQIAVIRGVSPDDLLKRGRSHSERDTAMYLCREVGQKGLREIGEAFGVKYAAVSLAVKRVKEKLDKDKWFSKQIKIDKKLLINKLKT